mgnify:CR=1 FL=1
MSQHVSLACDEGTWVPLIEYSIKSGLSLSTIRRKIKSNSIPYRLDKGKYFILFSDGTATSAENSVSMAPESKPVVKPTISPLYTDRKLKPSESEIQFQPSRAPYREPKTETPPVQTTHSMFERRLNEKDERIRHLEKQSREMQERINELQLLVRVLEEKYDVRY